jgi:hypothetical protein
VLITRDSPASDDPDDFDVAEFFVVRRYHHPEWAAGRPSLSGIDLPRTGLFASWRPTRTGFDSGRVSSQSTRAACLRRPCVPAARTHGRVFVFSSAKAIPGATSTAQTYERRERGPA